MTLVIYSFILDIYFYCRSSKTLSGGEAVARPGALADSPGPRAPQLSSRPGPRLLERLPPKNMVARRWLSTSRRVSQK